MILVLLGTQNNSFRRLLEKIQELIDKKVIKDKIIVQTGKTKFESKDMEIFDLIPKQELENLIKKADLIITHGGVGSIVTSLKMNKKVIAVPRLSEYGEHVNDHQIQIVGTFNLQGLLKGVFDLDDLEEAILNIDNFQPGKFESNTSKMIGIIEEFIDKN